MHKEQHNKAPRNRVLHSGPHSMGTNLAASGIADSQPSVCWFYTNRSCCLQSPEGRFLSTKHIGTSRLKVNNHWLKWTPQIPPTLGRRPMGPRSFGSQRCWERFPPRFASFRLRNSKKTKTKKHPPAPSLRAQAPKHTAPLAKRKEGSWRSKCRAYGQPPWTPRNCQLKTA